MKKLLTFVFTVFSFVLFAQTAPQAEPVYGGYIEHIDAIALNDSVSRVYVSTMSSNSVFYMEVDSADLSPYYNPFHTVPDLDADDNYGYVRAMSADDTSGYVFVAPGSGGLVACDTAPASLYYLDYDFIEAVEVYDSWLFYLKHFGVDEYLYFADIDPSGNVTSIDSVIIDYSPGWDPRFAIKILVNPLNEKLYVFVPDVPPLFYKTSDDYNALSSVTTFSQISVSDLASTGYEYVSADIAADGRIFAGSFEGYSGNSETRMSYTDSDGDPWITNIIADESGRGNLDVTKSNSSAYYVYFGRIMSDDNGLSWGMHSGADGAIKCDMNNDDVAYVRTDWGVGAFVYSSDTVYEINDGLEAVQVNDFAMSKGKDTAWVATKSGIWHVHGYSGSSPVWKGPIWPQDESVSWDRVATTISGDTMYAGNASGNVFRYESADGSLEDPMSYNRIFEATVDAAFPLWNWTYGTRVSAVAHDESYATERVLVGLYDEEDWDEDVDSLGGFFVGDYLGGSWTWQHITSSPIPATGMDVNDIVAVNEAGSSVYYVGVERNTTYSTVNGVYRIEDTGSGFTASQDLLLSATYPIAATIYDLHVTQQDTIFAAGTDASGTTVKVYKKAVLDPYWINITSSGLTSPDAARAIAYDDVANDLYIAVQNIIYILSNGASSWVEYFAYPEGTDIRFIYYDDLLAGTGTGLYSFAGMTVGVEDIPRSESVVLKITPNPAKDKVWISIESDFYQSVEIQLFNTSGKLMKHLNGVGVVEGLNEIPLNVSGLKGLYLLRIKTQQGIKSGRFVVL